MRRDQIVQLCKNGRLVVRRQRRDKADRHESIKDHFLRATDMLVRETALSERREVLASGCG